MTAIAERALTIDTPGVYDIPEDLYHLDPVPGWSLSNSGAKLLLPPSCPAKFYHERFHPTPPTRPMITGTAAHKVILGAGAPIHVVNADNFKKKAQQDERDEHEALGETVILRDQWAAVNEMAAQVRAHPLASVLLGERAGHAEQSIFWIDAAFGIWRRSRLDFLPEPTAAGRVLIADYKSCADASDTAIAKAVANFGYYRQDPWYRDAVAAIWPDADVQFSFVFQETCPPYLVRVVELHPDAVRAGRERNEQACEVFRDCLASGVWLGYDAEPAKDILKVRLPGWAMPRKDWYG
jgi:PDDEXK-like uncharacterized protein DUF3799